MGSRAPHLLALAALCSSVHGNDLPLSMESFIRVVQRIEGRDPGPSPLTVVRSLRGVAYQGDTFVEYFLGDSDSFPSGKDEAPMWDPTLSEFIHLTVRHRVTGQAREEGVVLGSDGTTVALGSLLLGIEAGLVAGAGESVSGLYSLTIARNLGLSFLRSQDSQILGPDGCWDNVTFPTVFTLSGPPSLATDALINGGMDGVLLGKYLSTHALHDLKLSTVLRDYYGPHPGGAPEGPRLVSFQRRGNFRQLVNGLVLQELILGSLATLQRLGKAENTAGAAALEDVVKGGVQEFVHRYLECPAIIPRCQWGARPYRGSPTQLKLPLAFMYIHHTSTPRQPCLSFPQCTADMRAMQRFHQDVRHWDDIGYSFVAGSDGYIYEGRGWRWRGAHTRGNNSRGYGIAFIGNYTGTLPARRSLELIRESLASCGVTGGQLTRNFTWHGHRQLVNTTCPGGALYLEIKSWKQFRSRDQAARHH
ncbi:N-acetylmuramoyl-L-alanine amidase [Brienomyrus brachyistius]|uniref:N-acetylmuramoyl-L-alanine amidase n=1 Tax=Brienomyrus brachyistius TaxID=42636 RepID=UPI0020B44B52|nr:N-acetylmuramoyl-L-alanine amidase [Brienomyrus brachyistius]